MDNPRILAINPGSTSTKIGVLEGINPLFMKTIRHTTEELEPFDKITEQFKFRKDIILRELQEADVQLELVKAIVGRGGLLKPIESGVYEVNDAMRADLLVSRSLLMNWPAAFPMHGRSSPIRSWWMNYVIWRVCPGTHCCPAARYFMPSIRKPLPVPMPNLSCESTKSLT